MTSVPSGDPAPVSLAWLDSLPEGCVVFDESLHVRYCNPVFAARTGYGVDELLGKHLPTWLPGFAGSVLHQLCEQVLGTGTPRDADEIVGRNFFNVRVHAVPGGVMAFVPDVTPRRQLEDDLAEAALHGRMLLEHLPTIHWTIDRELRFTLSKGAGLAALGLSHGEIVGRTLWDFYKTRDREHPSIRAHLRALQGERVSYSDSHYGRSFQCNLEPLRGREGNLIGVLGLAMDVTEQRLAEVERARLQQHLTQVQKLESLGVLAGGVAHDFNNLLVGILGAAELLLGDLPEASPHRELAEMIRRAGERASDVTRQMLVIAGKSPAARRNLDLNALVRDNLPLVASARQGQTPIETVLTAALPPVHGDAGQLQQVVMNLLLNAADAVQDRAGRVRVQTGTHHVPAVSGKAPPSPLRGRSALAPGWYVFLEVADNGCGIPADVQARIFDPFFTTKPAGRGLGLAAVQGIVRAHQGMIDLDSAPGRGTRFRVYFPVAGADRPTPMPGTLNPRARTATSVLVVDDEPFMRDLAARVLRGAGYRTHTASSGQEALALLARDLEAVHLVLLDLLMPGMDGWATMHALREMRPDLRFLLTSGQSEEDLRVRCRESQAAGYLAKPYALDTLLMAVERVLNGMEARVGEMGPSEPRP